MIAPLHESGLNSMVVIATVGSWVTTIDWTLLTNRDQTSDRLRRYVRTPIRPSAEALRRPEMGTETMAPLLYYLARFSRPRTVLEVGMGFTSLFLAQARWLITTTKA